MSKVHLADYNIVIQQSGELTTQQVVERFLDHVSPRPSWAHVTGFIRARGRTVTLGLKFYVNAYEATFHPSIHNIREDKPCYDLPPFTDEDRQRIFDMCCDEAADMSRREAGEQFMGNLDDDLPEAVGYASEQVDVLGECLRAIHNGNCCIEDLESGEHEEHGIVAKEMRKFNLIDANGQLTQLGGEVMNRWS